jgi:hypothetical protein
MMRRKLFVETKPPANRLAPEPTAKEILFNRLNKSNKNKKVPITLTSVWTEPKKKA